MASSLHRRVGASREGQGSRLHIQRKDQAILQAGVADYWVGDPAQYAREVRFAEGRYLLQGRAEFVMAGRK